MGTEQGEFTTALVRAMARRCGLEDPDAFAAKGGVMSMDQRLARLPSVPCPSQGGVRCVNGRIDGGEGCRSNGMRCPVCDGRGRVLVGGRESYVHGTGRTTRMLLQALCALECGCSVEVVAADPGQVKDLRQRFHDLVDTARSDRGRGLLGHMLVTTLDTGGAPRIDLQFVDHACKVQQGATPAKKEG